jgi:hypothetical protein
MDAVEIESAVPSLALEAFDRDEFPYVFLQAFGNKETTTKRLRAGNTNASDVPGGVLQRNNIHLIVCDFVAVGLALQALLGSPAILKAKAKAKLILAIDGMPCPRTCAMPMHATTKCSNASRSDGVLRTTPSGWKSCLRCIRK